MKVENIKTMEIREIKGKYSKQGQQTKQRHRESEKRRN